MIDFGHDPIPVTTVKCATCGRDIDAAGGHVPTYTDIQRVKEAERKAQVAALLVPYKGAIKVCQARVSSMWSVARCEAKPKWVRARMAVCGTHAKSRHVNRYGSEPLEPEYQ